MNQHNARPLTLYDLIARRWDTGAPVAALRFGATTAAFAGADGALRIAAAPDAEPPDSRVRVTGDLGQITLRPRSQDPAPLMALTGLADAAPPVAAAGGDFLVGAADGRVLRITPDGEALTLLDLSGPVRALDHAGGVTAAADAETLALQGEAIRRLPRPGVVALAVAPGGVEIAAAGADDLRLIGAATERGLALSGVLALAWRGDGRWLAAALGSEGAALVGPALAPVRLGGFPAPVRSLDWSGPGRAFVAAGAFRIAAWDAAALPATDRPLVTGQPGLVAVEAVAAHPARPLVAAGYANGQVTIAQAGARDELLLRHEGAPVTCLAFSPDGRHLAIGDAGGEAAIATFPSQMFK